MLAGGAKLMHIPASIHAYPSDSRDGAKGEQVTILCCGCYSRKAHVTHITVKVTGALVKIPEANNVISNPRRHCRCCMQQRGTTSASSPTTLTKELQPGDAQGVNDRCFIAEVPGKLDYAIDIMRSEEHTSE